MVKLCLASFSQPVTLYSLMCITNEKVSAINKLLKLKKGKLSDQKARRAQAFWLMGSPPTWGRKTFCVRQVSPLGKCTGGDGKVVCKSPLMVQAESLHSCSCPISSGVEQPMLNLQVVANKISLHTSHGALRNRTAAEEEGSHDLSTGTSRPRGCHPRRGGAAGRHETDLGPGGEKRG